MKIYMDRRGQAAFYGVHGAGPFFTPIGNIYLKPLIIADTGPSVPSHSCDVPAQQLWSQQEQAMSSSITRCPMEAPIIPSELYFQDFTLLSFIIVTQACLLSLSEKILVYIQRLKKKS